ncbi:MAG: diguanylate cyclase [Terracidiphilus sp.]|jgi:two-component system, cell cycle response regulator
MPAPTTSFLLASPQPALLAAIEPVLLRAASTVEVVLSAQAALAAMTGPNPPALALLDADLPGMSIDDLLAATRATDNGRRFPIVLIADTVTPLWIDRLAAGVLDDVILRSTEDSYWQLRIELVLRAFHHARQIDSLHEAAALSARTDHLTGVFNREALLTALFRETDRVQRLNGSMCLILFDIDDFGHWNSRLGIELCDELLRQVATRTGRLLRSYDLLGRPGMDEFLVALPGCSFANALMLVERLRADVFSVPFRVSGESIRLSACFGMASSQGRSPVVVLREAEEALQSAKAAGPESIQIFGDSLRPAHAPVTYLSPSSGDELIAW